MIYGGTLLTPTRWRQRSRGLASLPGHLSSVEANEIFIQLPEAVIAGLVADGFQFYRWEGEHSTTFAW